MIPARFGTSLWLTRPFSTTWQTPESLKPLTPYTINSARAHALPVEGGKELGEGTLLLTNKRLFLRAGSALLSNEGQPMMTIVSTTVDHHDTIGGACSRESNTLRYGHHTVHQHACVENFLAEGAKWGLVDVRHDVALA